MSSILTKLPSHSAMNHGLFLNFTAPKLQGCLLCVTLVTSPHMRRGYQIQCPAANQKSGCYFLATTRPSNRQTTLTQIFSKPKKIFVTYQTNPQFWSMARLWRATHSGACPTEPHNQAWLPNGSVVFWLLNYRLGFIDTTAELRRCLSCMGKPIQHPLCQNTSWRTPSVSEWGINDLKWAGPRRVAGVGFH
jgi:hypothetical protein